MGNRWKPGVDVDPRTLLWEGTAVHGDTPFSCTLVTAIDSCTYLGGCVDGISMPDDVEYVVSLYPWESYQPGDSFVESRSFAWFDAGLPALGQLTTAAQAVNDYRARGITLVHCQAGLNRSGLVLAFALVLEGQTPGAAIALLRERRDAAVLCNPAFQSWLLGLAT